MRKLSLLLFVAGSLWSPAGPAHATHEAIGFTCGLSSSADPVLEAGTYTGFLFAQVMATPPMTTVSITCTVQVGASNSTHAGADAASLTGTGMQTASVPAIPISYVWEFPQPVYVCTAWTVGATTYYFDGVNFSASSSVGCVAATTVPVHFLGPLLVNI